jgi:hypothetical protein
MRRALVAAVLVLAGCFAGPAQGTAPFGCAPELASLDFPEPRVCMETQGWWVQGQTSLTAPATDFPFTSTHVHLMIPFPMGEQIFLPPSGQGYSWPYLGQWHNGQGGTVRQVRAGSVNISCSDSSIPNDPGYRGVAITTQDQRHAGEIPVNATKVNCWRTAIGTREFRFTNDTTSKFGKRQYQSGAWNTVFNAPGTPVGFTARGWYEGPGYTNITLTTKTRSSTLASTGLPSTLSYSLAQGATWAFAYIDPNIHAGDKGTVLFENRTGSGGSFALPVLPPGTHVLLLGGWEKAGTGWNAGVLRLPFNAN